jgi:hypothetical protein
MSYDLNFWRYKPGVSLDHQQVYEQLCDAVNVYGLEILPIARMIVRVHEEFEDWEKLDDVTFERADRGSFQLSTSPQFFRVDCYGMTSEDMNKFIEIANEFGCPLYDPQVGRRFDGA